MCSGIQAQQRLGSILQSLGSYFGWQSEQVIQNTYRVTSRFGGTVPQHDYLKNISSPEILPSTNQEEMNLSPQILFYLPFMMEALWHNSFLARILWYVMVYGIKSQKQFINTFYDNIKTRGAMDTIITDGGKYEISKKDVDLLRSFIHKTV